MIEQCSRCDASGIDKTKLGADCPRCDGDGFVDPAKARVQVNEANLKRLLHLMNNATSITEAVEMVNLCDSLQKELGE